MGTSLETILMDLLELAKEQESSHDNLRIVEMVRKDLRPHHLEHLRNLEQIRDRADVSS